MVMESLPLEKNTSRTIHVLVFTEQRTRFNMGRGHDSEVRVNDISVSRCHAVINYQPDGMYISDNKSKFGTLVLCRQKSLPLQLNMAYQFQVGRTVCSLLVKQLERVKAMAEDYEADTIPQLTSDEASQYPKCFDKS